MSKQVTLVRRDALPQHDAGPVPGGPAGHRGEARRDVDARWRAPGLSGETPSVRQERLRRRSGRLGSRPARHARGPPRTPWTTPAARPRRSSREPARRLLRPRHGSSRPTSRTRRSPSRFRSTATWTTGSSSRAPPPPFRSSGGSRRTRPPRRPSTPWRSPTGCGPTRPTTPTSSTRSRSTPSRSRSSGRTTSSRPTARQPPIGVALGTVTAGNYTIIQKSGAWRLGPRGRLRPRPLVVNSPAISIAAASPVGVNGRDPLSWASLILPQLATAAAGPSSSPASSTSSAQ